MERTGDNMNDLKQNLVVTESVFTKFTLVRSRNSRWKTVKNFIIEFRENLLNGLVPDTESQMERRMWYPPEVFLFYFVNNA
jgi:hypothetical protein